jgi:hypothetical protein
MLLYTSSEFNNIQLSSKTTKVFLNLLSHSLIARGFFYNSNLAIITKILYNLKVKYEQNAYLTLYRFIKKYTLRLTVLDIELRGKKMKIPLPLKTFNEPYRSLLKNLIKQTAMSNFKTDLAENVCKLIDDSLLLKGNLYKT